MTKLIVLFLCGDLMTGRGIDQVLPHPGDPRLYEASVKSATEYVKLARMANGPIPQPVSFSYIWGRALQEFERVAPDVKIINLETSVTTSDDYWQGKAVNYRMHPKNIGCLIAAGIDHCSLANNHVLDWGYRGLTETLETLKKAGINAAGAGQNLKEASKPAFIQVEGKGRVIVFSLGSTTSGIPYNWAASENRPGVSLLENFSESTVERIKEKIQKVKRDRDIVVVSIHWGDNWGYEVPQEQRALAHQLIDRAGVDLIHGHSSHHVKGVEVYKDRLILFGCGDFLNDYEGISGYEAYRPDLSLMYFASVDPSTGKLAALEMTPTQVKRFRVSRVSREDALWLRDTLNREGQRFGTRTRLNDHNILTLQWK